MENEPIKKPEEIIDAEELFKEIIKPKEKVRIIFNCEVKMSKCPIEKLNDFQRELKTLMLKYQTTLITMAGFFIEPPQNNEGQTDNQPEKSNT